MKFKYYYILILIVCSLFALGSCSKVLDKHNLTAFNEEQTFNNLDLAKGYLSYIYDKNSPEWPGGDWMKCTEEEAGDTRYFEGTVQVNTVSDFGVSVSPDNVWGKLRMINDLLVNMKSSSLDPIDKNHLEGQAYFFRAYRYFELIKLYGGVPLVLKPQNAIGDEAKKEAFKSRSKTSECVVQITKDLDSSIAKLPGRWSSDDDWGRITSGAAAALKGRVLLTYASPQFNPDDSKERWQASYDANKEAIRILKENGFGLNPDYQDMWFQEVGNPEAVWSVGFNNSQADQLQRNEGWDASNRPGYMGGSGSNQPTKEIVDAFPMENGKDITASSSGYDSVLFYKNRDPRFYATIAFNGGKWALNGNSDYKLWTYTVDGTSVESDATTSGFYCKKAIDPDLKLDDVPYAGTDWMEIRYAEVVLNLAESACGIGKINEAYDGLVAIRKRAGIETGTNNLYGLKPNMTRDEMFKAILHERQIEFAFEGKRYWDLRRWKLFEPLLNGTRRTGVTIKLNTSAISADDFAAQRDTMNLDYAYENYFEIESKVLDTKFEINWQPNYYFFALPQQALDNDLKLKQTKGWPGGAFDPLK